MDYKRRRIGNFRYKYINYKKPGFFMITMNKQEGLINFSKIVHNHIEQDITKCCRPNYSRLGFVIFESLKNLDEITNKIKVRQYVIMPDHLHFILEITEELEMPLGKYLAIFKNNVFDRANEKKLIPENIISIFEPGFNDQYLLLKRKLDDLYHYIKMNPYWWWMRWERPEFFRRKHDIEVGGVKCSLYGNLALQDNPFKSAVIVHRTDMADPDVLERKMAFWEYTALNGGVVVGAFINKEEKRVRDLAFENGARVIWIRNISYEDRQKPSEGILKECAKGNLLIVSPDLDGELGARRSFREECLFMNDLAERIERNRR